MVLSDVYELSRAPITSLISTPPCKSRHMILGGAGDLYDGQSDFQRSGKAGTDETEHPGHPDPRLYLGKYEVTQAQHYRGSDDRQQRQPSPTPSNYTGSDLPVEQVSWDDIQIFLERLNEQEADNLPPGWAYVLPTEAQWEYACRAGTNTAYSWGDDINASLANYDNNIGQTANVGSYGANPWGFFDMHGNVWEWTTDWYAESYEAGPRTDPAGDAAHRARIGSVGVVPERSVRPHLRSAQRRGGNPPSHRRSRPCWLPCRFPNPVPDRRRAPNWNCSGSWRGPAQALTSHGRSPATERATSGSLRHLTDSVSITGSSGRQPHRDLPFDLFGDGCGGQRVQPYPDRAGGGSLCGTERHG